MGILAVSGVLMDESTPPSCGLLKIRLSIKVDEILTQFDEK